MRKAWVCSINKWVGKAIKAVRLILVACSAEFVTGLRYIGLGERQHRILDKNSALYPYLVSELSRADQLIITLKHNLKHFELAAKATKS